MKTIYLVRHSEPLQYQNIVNSDPMQVENEKQPLSVNGERIAKEKSMHPELQNFDIVFSSKYVRAMSTAKYFTNDSINIVEQFGERKFGINDWSELPKDFGESQFSNFDYKMPNGESLNEVKERELYALNKILDNYSDKKVLIVGHSTAFASLFSKWCEINLESPYYYKGKEFFNGNWEYCESFKLIFDDSNELVDIINIK